MPSARPFIFSAESLGESADRLAQCRGALSRYLHGLVRRAGVWRRHLEEDRADEALELYQGDLLPSFFVPDAPGFEEWLERERHRLSARRRPLPPVSWPSVMRPVGI